MMNVTFNGAHPRFGHIFSRKQEPEPEPEDKSAADTVADEVKDLNAMGGEATAEIYARRTGLRGTDAGDEAEQDWLKRKNK